MEHLPNLVEVDNIEERFRLNRTTIWKKVRKNHLGPKQGVYLVGTRNYRFDPRLFGQWLLLNEDQTAGQLPPPPDLKAPEPASDDALKALRADMNLVKAALTRLEEKVTGLPNAVAAALGNGRRQHGTAGNKRSRR
jgi:hypothetical protein